MLLHDLDEDVLGLIVSYLSPIRQDVVNLALACRSFYPITKYPEHISVTCPSAQYLALTNIFIEDPSYGHKMLSLHLRVDAPKCTIRRSTIDAFFQRVPNLRTLRLEADVKPHYTNLLLSPNLSFQNTLQTLHLTDSSLTVQEILNLLSLPKLRHLNLASDRPIHYSPPSTPQSPFLHLQTLRLNSLLPASILASILPRTLQLSSLRWKIALPANTLQTTLSHLSQSLVSLNLSTNRQTWVSHEIPPLDLSAFVCLTHVVASAELFFTPLSPQISRDGFFDLLPYSLKSITIYLPFQISLFYNLSLSHVDKVGRQAFLRGKLDPSLYNFIAQIADQKRERFPNLTKVELLEGVGGNRGPFVEESWVPPRKVREKFEETGTELRVVVRADKVPGRDEGWVHWRGLGQGFRGSVW
ncbi:uncharacterized protein LY89DRAFT_786894 [Mollisia scopiformis]|uniref:F-box domain-containing protein n=1 Tax=Mollisia scopiformis TaxID=149040 RepID=A0A194WUD2_MOLSC|nr:uncharacterized protein LY89DRAFT_786894 [Mollisia scopiformis]KUJ11279.1 hypothetical protein LY89DRAFT_786894 [Mollisia scopiformis]